MKFENINLQGALIEDMKNAPVRLEVAQNWAHARTHPLRKKERIRHIKDRIQLLEARGAPASIIENARQRMTMIESESEVGLFAEVMLYETVEGLIETIQKRVVTGASIVRLREWFSKNMSALTPSLAMQVDDAAKDNVLDIVSALLAGAVTFCREDLVHKHMNVQQIAEYAAARKLEDDHQNPELEDAARNFPHLAGELPEVALAKATQELALQGRGALMNVSEVTESITDRLRSILREVLRYPPAQA